MGNSTLKGGSMSRSPNQTDDPGEDQIEEATKREEAREAHAPHEADRPPSAEEEAAAEATELDPEVAEHEREMGRIGAEVKGEGEVR
jgi:hypothetical protein